MLPCCVICSGLTTDEFDVFVPTLAGAVEGKRSGGEKLPDDGKYPLPRFGLSGENRRYLLRVSAGIADNSVNWVRKVPSNFYKNHGR